MGTKAVNGLSRHFLVRSHREGQYVEAVFKQGRLKKQTEGTTPEPDGTCVEFKPDPGIFKEFKFRSEHVERRLQR